MARPHFLGTSLSMTAAEIHHVSDTAIWTAYYRARESERADALFQDPMASKLIGDRGAAIHSQMRGVSKYAKFNVVMRTLIIDRFINKLVKNGVDTVLNLGAGLDTRPYRLRTPSDLRWIEVDYPHVIQLKNDKLKNERPLMQLERIPLDLADRQARREIFARIGAQSKKILVLTEGVLPYLTEVQVGELADDLRSIPTVYCWIAEYLSPQSYRYINNAAHKKGMQNAPFQFMPSDWFGLFRSHGWNKNEIAFMAEEAVQLGRSMPRPWWAYLLMPLMPPKMKAQVRQMTGYVVFT